MFTAEELCSLNSHDVIPPRSVRKTIFSLRLWQPVRQRRQSQRLFQACCRRRRRPGVSNDRSLTVGCVNACSANNKAATLSRTIVDERLDVLVITETWHEGPESTTLKRLTPPGFRCVVAARPIPPGAATDTVDFQNHGGLAIIRRDIVRFQKRTLDQSPSTFEYLYGYASTADSQFVLLGIYRPGSDPLTLKFFDELSTVFEQLVSYRCPVVVCGDFNVHYDLRDDGNAVRLREVLQSFGLVQHVTEPTHARGHTLDLVITKSVTDVLSLRVGGMISDHALIRFVLPLKRLSVEAQWVTCRAWRRLSRDAFASDLEASELCADLDTLVCKSADDLAQLYRGVLTGLLDKHCPAVKVQRRSKKATPWFDADCRAARRHTRAAERRFRRSRSSADKLEWDKKMKSLRLLYNEKHDGYWRNEISVNKGNSQGLWRTLHGVLGDFARDDASPHCADDYAKYFKDKIDSVRASTAATPTYDVPRRVTSSFAEFTAVTAEEVAKLISCAPNKTCQLDPVPTWLVKDMSNLLSPFIALLVNKSLTTGCFPADFKEAIIRPLLKREGLDLSDLKNYRPVSNLPFLSK